MYSKSARVVFVVLLCFNLEGCTARRPVFNNDYNDWLRNKGLFKTVLDTEQDLLTYGPSRLGTAPRRLSGLERRTITRLITSVAVRPLDT